MYALDILNSTHRYYLADQITCGSVMSLEV